jgi:hypothetical protein
VLKDAYSCNPEVARINYLLSAYYYIAGNRELSLNFFKKGLHLNAGEYHYAFKSCSDLQHDPEIISFLKKTNKK